MRLLTEQWGKHVLTRSPRAAAFLIKALSRANCEHDEYTIKLLTHYADFLADLYRANARTGWEWFEGSLTYSNALLPEALLKAYEVTGNQEYFRIGQESLDFLISHSFDGDLCMPIGQNGWFEHGREKHIYDQQPEEVSALILALTTMIQMTEAEGKKAIYEQKRQQAFNWFL